LSSASRYESRLVSLLPVSTLGGGAREVRDLVGEDAALAGSSSKQEGSRETRSAVAPAPITYS
jgi:hypothetical protein